VLEQDYVHWEGMTAVAGGAEAPKLCEGVSRLRNERENATNECGETRGNV
jgi:hypothetical protein